MNAAAGAGAGAATFDSIARRLFDAPRKTTRRTARTARTTRRTVAGYHVRAR